MQHLLYTRSQGNPADFGTRPQSIEINFGFLKPQGYFRTGPAFLTKGLERAIQEKNLIQMNQITQKIQEQELEELLNLPHDTEKDIDPPTFDSNEQKTNAIDTVLLINFSNTKFLEDVQRTTEFSRYLIIHPLTLSYPAFHLSLTVCFKFLSRILSKTEGEGVIKAIANILTPLDSTSSNTEDNGGGSNTSTTHK